MTQKITRVDAERFLERHKARLSAVNKMLTNRQRATVIGALVVTHVAVAWFF